MPDAKLHCERCGKTIPPREAEAEDYAASGGGKPVCLHCLLKSDTARHSRVIESRSTRLRLMAAAQPPKQLYPAPGADAHDSPTRTSVRELRAEVQKELEEELEDFRRRESTVDLTPIDPAEALAELRGEPPPARRKERRIAFILLWAILLASVALSLVLWHHTPLPAETLKNNEAQARPPFSEDAPPPPQGKTSSADLEKAELLFALSGSAPNLDEIEQVLKSLSPLKNSSDPAARLAATERSAKLEQRADALARESARHSAENARAALDREEYSAAREILQRARAALPGYAPWAAREGSVRLEALEKESVSHGTAALKEKMEALDKFRQAGKIPEAYDAARLLARHPDPEFQAAAQLPLKELQREAETRAAALRAQEEIARGAWPEFFKAFDAALGALALQKAQALCRPPANSPLYSGGVENPAETLNGFAEVVQSISALQEFALKGAAALGAKPHPTLGPGSAPLHFTMLSGGAITGWVKGVDGRMVMLELPSPDEAPGTPAPRALMKASIEHFTLTGLETLLQGLPEAERARQQPALWVLQIQRKRLAEESFDAEVFLSAQYKTINQPLPLCWARRFAVEKWRGLRQDLEHTLGALRQAVQNGQPAAVRAALETARPMLQKAATLLTPEERETVNSAERIAGSVRPLHLVFQNGALPTPAYNGLRLEQINRYYANRERSNPDAGSGLKLGSWYDLQRALVRFDGLSEALGKGRARKAVLELYQLPGNPPPATAKGEPAPAPPVAGLFRLKKAWKPGASNWEFADAPAKVSWQKPGASGPDDLEDQLEAQLELDQQAGRWRALDVTAYVNDVLDAKAGDFGLLLKIIEDEPFYDFRFYPSTTLDLNPNNGLRPRLVIEFEKE